MSRKKKKNIIVQKQKLTGLGSLGKGFVKTDDKKIIFAKYGVPGDIVDITIKKKRSSYLEGDIVKIHKELLNIVDSKLPLVISSLVSGFIIIKLGFDV